MRALTGERQLVLFALIRVTALMLAVLVLGHFVVTHFVTDVAETDSTFVVKRWSQALWIAWDSTMLLAALIHAGCGIWLMIDQGFPRRETRRLLQVSTAIATGALAFIGIAAVAVGVIRT